MGLKNEIPTVFSGQPNKPPPNDSIFNLFANSLGSFFGLPNWKLALLSSIFLAAILSLVMFRKYSLLNRKASVSFICYALLSTTQLFIVHSFIFPNVFPYELHPLSYVALTVALFVIELFKRVFLLGNEVRLAKDNLLLDKLFKNHEYRNLYRLFLIERSRIIWCKDVKIDESGKTYFMKNNLVIACKESFENDQDNNGRIRVIAMVLFGGDYEKAKAFFKEYKKIIIQQEKKDMAFICELLIKLKDLDSVLSKAINILELPLCSNIKNSNFKEFQKIIGSFRYPMFEFSTFKDAFEWFRFSIDDAEVLNDVCNTLTPQIKEFNKNDMGKINEESYIKPLIESINAIALDLKTRRGKTNS